MSITATATTPPPPAPERPRIEGLDVLRLLCAVGVVILHVVAQAELVTGNMSLRVYAEAMRWAVPALFVISGILAGWASRRGFWKSLARRADRLLIPYVVWLVVYLIAAMAVDHEHFPSLADLIFHGGSTYASHLWFLPSLLLCVPFGLLLRDRRVILVAVGVAAALILARTLTGWVTPLDWPIATEYPFLNWLEMYLLGVAIGAWSEGRPLAGTRTAWTLPAALALAVGGSAAVELTVGSTTPLGYLSLTVLAVVLAVSAYGSLRLSAGARMLCDTAMGVYLIHPLLMAALGRIWVPTTTNTALWIVVVTAADFALSAALTLALLRVPLLKRTVI